MADVDYDEFEGDYNPPAAHPMQRWTTLAGGVISLVLVVGIGVWGYNIAMRDAMGVPVVRALEGPMRVAPENPGGEIAAHQGLSVNDVAATGVASPVPDSMILAPRPVDLSADDTAGLAAEAPTGEAPANLGPALAATDVAPLTAETLLPEPVALDSNTNISDLADSLAAGVAPLAPSADSPEVEVVSGGVGRSIRPMARPRAVEMAATAGSTGVSAAAADAAVMAALGAGSAEVDVASLPAGTRLVQLGAFDNEDQARGEWDRLAARFGDLMVGKSRVVQSAQSGGRTFYRLRAHGFDGEDDARRFCSALVAENAECIPVALR